MQKTKDVPKHGFYLKSIEEFKHKNEIFFECKKTQGNKKVLKTENKQELVVRIKNEQYRGNLENIRLRLSEFLQDSNYEAKFYTLNCCVVSAGHAIFTDTRKSTTSRCQLKALSLQKLSTKKDLPTAGFIFEKF